MQLYKQCNERKVGGEVMAAPTLVAALKNHRGSLL